MTEVADVDSDNESDGRPSNMGSQAEPAPSVPRWVKVFGLIGLVLVVLVIALQLLGGNSHGPGRHNPDADTQPSVTSAVGHVPPMDHLP